MTAIRWKISGNVIDLTNRAMLMGVLNVTPDSFSDGGQFFATETAVRHGIDMARMGADIIDVGGESTRPGATPVSPNEEMDRILPVIEGVAKSVLVHISVDTSKALVARAALKAGARIVNDVTGGRDPEMFGVVAETGAGVIIMHMQGTPQTMQLDPVYEDVVGEVRTFFEERYAAAVKAGVEPMCIAFDPGIGFGKTAAHNMELLANLPRLRVHDRPFAVGVSRKSFLSKIAGAHTEKSIATVALTSLLRERGAEILRVHEVAPNNHALRTTEALLGATR